MQKFFQGFLFICLFLNFTLPILAKAPASNSKAKKITSTKKKPKKPITLPKAKPQAVKANTPNPTTTPLNQAPNQNKTPSKNKTQKVLELIQNREQELKDKMEDMNELYQSGLVTLQDSQPLKEELAEIEQFEFIVKNPYTNSYENALKDKLSIRLKDLKKEIDKKEALAAEGLIAPKDIILVEDKAALYNYILEFLSEDRTLPPLPGFLSSEKRLLSSKAILGRFYPIESRFGFRIDPINPRRKQFHAGVDFPAWTGVPVLSPFDGVVVKTVFSTGSGGGRQVKIKHAEGFETVYMHLSEIKVKRGQRLQQGSLIGYVGSSGYRVTGPHLHFEVHLNSVPVNPERFFTK